MKPSQFSLLFFLVVSSGFCQDLGVKVSSSIKDVKVFTAGAQVTRAASANIEAGKTTLIFTGLSPQLVESSVQFTTLDFLNVLSVKYQYNALENKSVRDEVALLEARSLKLAQQLKDKQNLLKVYQNEETILTKNQVVNGQNVGLKMADLKAVIDYQRAQYAENLRNQTAISIGIKTTDSLYQLVVSQLNQIRGNVNKSVGELHLTIQSEKPAKAAIVFSYFVNEAGWFPTYDFKVTDINSPIDLKTKAEVYQNTGEDWKNVNLSLSTGNPTENAVAPAMEPWFIAKEQLEEVKVRGYTALSSVTISDELISSKGKDSNFLRMLQSQVAGVSANNAIVSSQTTTVSFTVTEPFTVLADGNRYTADLERQTVPAQYRYFSIPKLDKAAYLNADIVDWQSYNLLPGVVNLYFENTYLGKSTLNIDSASDTLSVSLGRDKGIVIDRVKRKEFTKKQFLSSMKTESRGFDISVKNNKKVAINITVLDQLPISTESDVTIFDEEVDGGKVASDTKEVKWELLIEAKAEVKKQIKFSVKSPKESIVRLDR